MTGEQPTYTEAAVREVLTAADPGVDAAVGHAALLIAAAGAAEEADRLVRRWRAATERPLTALVAGPVQARAWAMLFATRSGGAPDWAAELPPLDLDEEEAAHRAHLERTEPALPSDLLGDSTVARIVTGVADRLDEPRAPDPLRALAAEAESCARAGEQDAAKDALRRWAELAWRRPRPDVATLAACRHVAPLLAGGALPVPDEWPGDCAGALVAALHTRYRPVTEHTRHGDWLGLVTEIMRLRDEPDAVPPPAAPAEVTAAQMRLGVPLPGEYREFLLACDGLPADVVFPRLLAASELGTGGTAAGIAISDPPVLVLHPGSGRVTEHDPLFGSTSYAGVRAVLEEHRRLLEAAR
ncbi:SMI1/KNR4 family protein [Qaidamihabitans albus]|uniref:SMI1/KNR4 family protein n=1 Tax=Qaidamihabitans albus TaxID=2795733 RepID=UPI0018F1A52B|nr:SMI1/KNR4 family protein [Qaidamihabitans albus]